jgi:hypothetical protein
VRLPAARLLLLFVLGAVVAPLGDHGHVATGTTRYLDRGVPFVWDSAIWFMALVGLATAATAELRLRLAPARRAGSWADGLAAIAAVMGIYAVTALVHDQPLGPSTLLIYALAVLTWRAFGGDWPSAVCGLAVAVVGPAVEMLLSAADVSEYGGRMDDLLGVAPWLPGLYFAFGVAAARLGELLAPERTGAATA